MSGAAPPRLRRRTLRDRFDPEASPHDVVARAALASLLFYATRPDDTHAMTTSATELATAVQRARVLGDAGALR